MPEAPNPKGTVMTHTPTNRLLICATCECAEGRSARQDCAQIRGALKLAGLSDQIEVEATPCLGGCTHPVNIGLQGAGKGSYVFDSIDTQSFEAEIVTLCQMYLDLPKGWIEDARPLGKLRDNLRARIPALD